MIEAITVSNAGLYAPTPSCSSCREPYSRLSASLPLLAAGPGPFNLLYLKAPKTTAVQQLGSMQTVSSRSAVRGMAVRPRTRMVCKASSVSVDGWVGAAVVVVSPQRGAARRIAASALRASPSATRAPAALPRCASRPVQDTCRVAVLGASGYTGAEVVRLSALHPNIQITALTGEKQAGKVRALWAQAAARSARRGKCGSHRSRWMGLWAVPARSPLPHPRACAREPPRPPALCRGLPPPGRRLGRGRPC